MQGLRPAGGNPYTEGNRMFHTLDDQNRPIPSPSAEAEAFFRSNERIVGLDTTDKVKISTVFLGLDHGFSGTPLWFETMIFGGAHDGYQERYTTWEEAETGHQIALALTQEK